MFKFLESVDPEIAHLSLAELARQRTVLEMIPSENFTSLAVQEAKGTWLSNKYAEGYPDKRYYGGNEVVDQIENLAIARAKQLFGAEHANVQPNAGSGANMAAYFALLELHDKIMAMSLSMGGHLTHGSPVNFSGKWYTIIPYGVRHDTEMLDYDEIREIAKREKPKLIVAGYTAYPRTIDFAKFREIANEINALLMVDMSHIAGLIAGKVHPDPAPHADVVTSTTHKTLRGPRSAFILSRAQYAGMIDKAVMPGLQGGPLEDLIAAKAVCFKEAMEPSFADYARRIVENARVLAEGLAAEGLRLISGGTDNHLILINTMKLGVSGKIAETALDAAGITVNKNTIPYDERKPLDPSGIRIGTPALTTRGFTTEDMKIIATLIAKMLRAPTDGTVRTEVKEKVRELCEAHPLYPELE